MAGHSKWSNIQHRKGRQDAKKAKIFTKIIREITVAARTGVDPSHNPALRLALDKAFSNNLSKEATERAIKRGSGDSTSENYIATTYEGYAKGGVAVLVECLTDNINRTVSEVRHAFSKFGGNLGTNGSVAYLFHSVGLFIVQTDDENALVDLAIESGAENINPIEKSDQEEQKNLYEINCSIENYDDLKQVFNQAKLKIIHSERTKICDNEIECAADTSLSIQKTIDMLEDLDDVQEVYHNAKLVD